MPATASATPSRGHVHAWARPDPRPGERDADQPDGFELRRAVELDQQGLLARVVFAGVYALIAVAVMPWQLPAAWIASLVVWELLSPRLFTPWMRALPDDQPCRRSRSRT